MTEATKRPWYATGIHVQSAATNKDNYVCTAEGETPEAAIANADLIVKAGNNHDALVAACKNVEEAWAGAGDMATAVDSVLLALDI